MNRTQPSWPQMDRYPQRSAEAPRYRSRLVCTEVRHEGVDSIFSATPPLETLWGLFGVACQEDVFRVRTLSQFRQRWSMIKRTSLNRSGFEQLSKTVSFFLETNHFLFLRSSRFSCSLPELSTEIAEGHGPSASWIVGTCHCMNADVHMVLCTLVCTCLCTSTGDVRHIVDVMHTGYLNKLLCCSLMHVHRTSTTQE